MAALITTAWRAICRGGSLDVRLNRMLAYFGISSVVFYIASPRFLQLYLWDAGATFASRYVLIACFCALLAIIWKIISLPRSGARPILIGSVFGFCLALATTAIYPSVTGHFMAALERYRFLIAAADFRKSCAPEEVFIYQVTWSSPLIFCNSVQVQSLGAHSPKGSSSDDYGQLRIYFLPIPKLLVKVERL